MRAVCGQGRMDVVCAVAAFQRNSSHEGIEGGGRINASVAAGGVARWLVVSDATDLAWLVADEFLEVPRQTGVAIHVDRLRPSGDTLAVGEGLPAREHGGPARRTRLALESSLRCLEFADDALGACVCVSRRRKRGLVEARLACVACAWCVWTPPRAGTVDPLCVTCAR